MSAFRLCPRILVAALCAFGSLVTEICAKTETSWASLVKPTCVLIKKNRLQLVTKVGINKPTGFHSSLQAISYFISEETATVSTLIKFGLFKLSSFLST